MLIIKIIILIIKKHLNLKKQENQRHIKTTKNRHLKYATL